VTGAGPIFHAVMLAATKGRESAGATAILAPHAGLERATICALSGMRANGWCPSRAAEWTLAGDDPRPCSWHHEDDGRLLTIYPAEYRAWAAQSGVRDVREIREAGEARSRPAPDALRAPDAPLRIANPPPGAIYSVDPTLRREFQALPLRAITARPTTVTWLVDGAPIGTESSDAALAWPLAVGPHRIEVRDAAGRRATTSVTVK
jgi:penicillin-binding protein 1C